MATLCCTRKLLAEVGLSKAPVVYRHADDWHADLIRIGSKKIVLFCATDTLYCCLTPVSSRSEIRAIQVLFREALEATLVSDGFSRSAIDYCLQKHAQLEVGPTYDRSVLGTMKDHVLNLRYYIELEAGIDFYDRVELAARLNDTPHVKRDFHNARAALQRKLGGRDT